MYVQSMIQAEIGDCNFYSYLKTVIYWSVDCDITEYNTNIIIIQYCNILNLVVEDRVLYSII